MATPSRSAISIRVSVARAVTSRPSRTNVTVAASVCARISRVTAFMVFSLTQFVGKVFDDGVDGIRRGLPETADRCIAHDLRKLRQQRLIPSVPGDQHVGLRGADAARRALTA